MRTQAGGGMTTLQKEVIYSLETLVPRAHDPARIKRLARLLKQKNICIPEEDYPRVLFFILALLNEMPDILKNPARKPLEQLSMQCINHFEVVKEIQKKASPR
jgi:hypothetical protein